MKKLFCLLLLSLLSTAAAYAEDISALQIVTKSWRLYRLPATEKETVEIDITRQGGMKESKALTHWIKYDADKGEDKITIVFHKPAMDDGLALLTWRHAEKSDDQWLKLPSMGKVRRVSVADQEKYFAGTDLTYEDLRQLDGERTRDFNYRILSKEGDHSVIEASPKAGLESAYGKRIFWINGAFANIRTEFYSRDGRLIKVQTNSRISVQKNGMWRADQVEMQNLMLNRNTAMKITQRTINPAIPADLFSVKFLEGNQR
jgi:hypothetical protein